MNSTLQCLSNLPELRDYFVKDRYKNSLNLTAREKKGELAKAFAELLKLMWNPAHCKVARYRTG